MKSNFTHPNLLESLRQAKEISQAASPQTPRLQRATQYIGDFIANINATLDTDKNQAFKTVENLVEGLMTVKLYSQCYENRLEKISFVSAQCKSGVDGLDKLYSNAMSLFTVSLRLFLLGVTFLARSVGITSIRLLKKSKLSFWKTVDKVFTLLSSKKKLLMIRFNISNASHSFSFHFDFGTMSEVGSHKC